MADERSDDEHWHIYALAIQRLVKMLDIDEKGARDVLIEDVRRGRLRAVGPNDEPFDVSAAWSMALDSYDMPWRSWRKTRYNASDLERLYPLPTKAAGGRPQEFPWERIAFYVGGLVQKHPGLKDVAIVEHMREEALRLVKRTPSPDTCEQKLRIWKRGQPEN